MQNNPYVTYKSQAIKTMTPVELVIKIYDECERQLNRSIHFIETKDFEEAHFALDKTGQLINALRSVLDMEVREISSNLDSLYEYFFVQILLADNRKDIGIIKMILPQISELKDAFVQVSKLPKATGQSMVSTYE